MTLHLTLCRGCPGVHYPLILKHHIPDCQAAIISARKLHPYLMPGRKIMASVEIPVSDQDFRNITEHVIMPFFRRLSWFTFNREEGQREEDCRSETSVHCDTTFLWHVRHIQDTGGPEAWKWKVVYLLVEVRFLNTQLAHSSFLILCSLS